MTSKTRISEQARNEMLDEAVRFIMSQIPNTRLLNPDGGPEEDWLIFYADTWEHAREKAITAMGVEWANEEGLVAKLACHGAALGNYAYGKLGDMAVSSIGSAASGAPYEVLKDLGDIAALCARYLGIAANSDFENKQDLEKYLDAGWSIVSKGYGFLGFKNGKSVVYAIESGNPKASVQIGKDEVLEVRMRNGMILRLNAEAASAVSKKACTEKNTEGSPLSDEPLTSPLH